MESILEGKPIEKLHTLHESEHAAHMNTYLRDSFNRIQPSNTFVNEYELEQDDNLLTRGLDAVKSQLFKQLPPEYNIMPARLEQVMQRVVLGTEPD